MINVTHLHCPAREPAIPGDEKTHHLVPRADGMTCLFCKRTERELREEATVHQELMALGVGSNTMSEAYETVTKLLTPSIPEGPCGAIHENPTATEPAWGQCVFLANHEGEHSWQ